MRDAGAIHFAALRTSGSPFSIATGSPANSSIGRSFVLSPNAMTCARGMPSRSARNFSAEPLSTPGIMTSTLSSRELEIDMESGAILPSSPAKRGSRLSPSATNL